MTRHSLLANKAKTLVLVDVETKTTFLDCGFMFAHNLQTKEVDVYSELGDIYKIRIDKELQNIISGVQFDVRLFINETGFKNERIE